jgi:hypothetical protein
VGARVALGEDGQRGVAGRDAGAQRRVDQAGRQRVAGQLARRVSPASV